jgi:hydroxyethylthiazole kinase-like uncharacterized protein yjeF
MDDGTTALLTTSEMAEADRLTTAAGTPGRVLMQRAGAAVARCAETLHRRGAGTHILVLCGPGNNGGDGFDAARLLRDDGYDLRVALLGGRAALRGDAEAAAQDWAGPIEEAAAIDFGAADVVIDALFGAGLGRDLDGAALALVLRINAWRHGGNKVIAVDVPSGIDGNSGAVRGAAVEADKTVTFFRRKPGHLLLPGRIHCGETSVADIGISADVLAAIAPRARANVPALWRDVLPVPTIAGHKYSRGHAVVVSGGIETTGAARLAARGALRAGAGLVTVATPRDALPVHAAALNAVMTRVADEPAGLAKLLADARKNAVVMGPGLGIGETTCDLMRVALAPSPATRALVLDADALTSFATHRETLFGLIAQAPGAVVLTPHAGEFARLFGKPHASKLDAAREAAKRSGAIILFKGPDTIVAAPDGRASIADNAPPWLATAGSGDVLAGMIGGFLAQGMPAFEAASAAVWMHGDAAARFGIGLIAEDIAEQLPAVWRGLA